MFLKVRFGFGPKAGPKPLFSLSLGPSRPSPQPSRRSPLSLAVADRWGPLVGSIVFVKPPPPETLAQAAAVSFQIRPILSFSGRIF